MAVVVVGDIDVDDMEELVTETFGSLSNPDGAPERPTIEVDRPTEPVASVLRDPEATTSTLDVFYLLPSPPTGPATVGDLQETLALAMAIDVMERRMGEDALRGLVPFFEVDGFDTNYTRRFQATGFSVTAEAEKLEASAEALLAEIARAAEFGFLDDEVDLARGADRSVQRAASRGSVVPPRRAVRRRVR